MVLMLRDSDDVRFFVLSQRDGDRPGYTVSRWPLGSTVDIAPDSSTDVPDAVRNVVRQGVPIPRDGSLFGWNGGDAITALIAVYAMYTPASPNPSWAVMPLAEIPAAEWPPFTREPFFGRWFWEHYWAANLISLSGSIAATPDTVFWVNTKPILGSDCCAVKRDIDGPQGHTLRQGRYAYYEALQGDRAVPPLSALLEDVGKTDLAPRFQQWSHSGGIAAVAP